MSPSATRAVPFRSAHWRASSSLVLLGLFALLTLAVFALGFDGLTPTRGGFSLAREFFGHALTPSWSYEARFVPAGTQPLAVTVMRAALRTLVFAAAAMSLAVPAGACAAFVLSRTLRESLALDGRPFLRPLFRILVPGLRLLLILLRSVHELLWAVLLLAAFGLTPLAGVFALAVPVAATLAKVYAELLDESAPQASRALDGLGAPPLLAFVFGRLSCALPDIATYTFYRFECCVRSSAVLGFFGFSTLGFYLAASFDNVHFGEVWTYLYALIALVLMLESVGRRLRRRLLV